MTVGNDFVLVWGVIEGPPEVNHISVLYLICQKLQEIITKRAPMIYCLNIPMETKKIILDMHWTRLILRRNQRVNCSTRLRNPHVHETHVRKKYPNFECRKYLISILHHIMAYLPWYDIPEMALSRTRQCCRFLATSYTFPVTIILINKQTNKQTNG